MEELLYYCFETPKSKYMYVRNINSIVRITDEEFRELLLAKKTGDRNLPTIKKYEKLGIFFDNPVKYIEHPNTEILEFQAQYLCQQLTLQVTQQCNLRCEYCTYSGVYNNRTHTSKQMTFGIAKKSIDFFLEHSRDSEKLTFGFYGGEPLLMFDLIKKCIEYIETMVEGKEILYVITTNGTLLTNEIIDYFVKHNVMLSISLDGAKDDHDLYRKFVSGKGTFDTIMDNIKNINIRYPEYSKNIRFLPVISTNKNLTKILEFFSTNVFLKENIVNYSNISQVGLKDEYKNIKKTNLGEFELVYNYEYLKMFLACAGLLPQNNVNGLFTSTEDYQKKFYERLKGHDQLHETTHHGGPCIPGVTKLFVTVEGEFYPCEKVSEINRACCIGNIESGFDFLSMRKLLNLGKITREECKKCWNLSNCTICIAKLETNTKNSAKEVKLCVCEEEKADAEAYIYTTAVLSEFGYINEKNEVKIYE